MKPVGPWDAGRTSCSGGATPCLRPPASSVVSTAKAGIRSINGKRWIPARAGITGNTSLCAHALGGLTSWQLVPSDPISRTNAKERGDRSDRTRLFFGSASCLSWFRVSATTRVRQECRVGDEKPKARGADRDSAPRAFDRPRIDFADRLLPDLGPPRSAQHERPGWLELAPTVDRDDYSRPLAQWGGRAVSRPDGRGFRFARQHKSASPGPVPRIVPDRPGVAAMPVPDWVRRVACRRSLTSRCDTSLAATLARPVPRGFPRISSGRPPERLLPPGASFDAVAGRRQPPCPQSGCFARSDCRAP